MIKKFLLFTIIFLLPALGTRAEYDVLSMDHTTQEVRESQSMWIRHQSLNLAEKNPQASLNTAKELLKLPAAAISRQQKTLFFRQLAKKLEQFSHYKEALSCYKIADSLAAISKLNIENQPATPVVRHGFSKAFYFFIGLLVIFLIFPVYSMLGFLKLNSKRKALQKKQSKLNKELNQLHSDLDAKVKAQNLALYKDLESMKDQEVALKTALKKAEEAAFLRNAFIANLGFDLRTPLNSIIGFANMLETELAVRENLELYEYASNIEKSGHRLLKLLNNVIDLSSLESNALKLYILPVHPGPVIKKVYEQYKSQAGDKNLIFKNKIDPDLRPVLADEKGLEKVIMQIVDNAVKYTESGFVTLSALYDSRKDIDVIEIKDTGPGIDKKHQKFLFELETPDGAGPIEHSEGTGIGLKLARKLMDLMKAELELDSTPGSGTTFRLFFPCSKKAVILKSVPKTKEQREVTTAAELGDLDIFVLEDDRMNRLILEKMLKDLGKVTSAVDGNDCMEIIDTEASKKHFYQIMLFDINLPGEKDGVALMKEIRNKYPEYRKIPFIAQTAYAMSQDEEYFLKEGFDSYLSKPINRDELISTIKQQFSIYELSKK